MSALSRISHLARLVVADAEIAIAAMRIGDGATVRWHIDMLRRLLAEARAEAESAAKERAA